MLHRYNSFVNENMSAAKEFMIKKELAKLGPRKPSKGDKSNAPVQGEEEASANTEVQGDATVSTPATKRKKKQYDDIKKSNYSEEELNKALADIKKDPDFRAIVEMLKKNTNYIYAFTRFFYTGERSIEDLKMLFEKLEKYKLFLNQLPQNIDDYGAYEKESPDDRDGFERLGDDLDQIALDRLAKKFINQIPSNLRREYEKSNDAIKSRVRGIAKAFDEFGTKKGIKNDAANQQIQSAFFAKSRRYDPQSDTNSPFLHMSMTQRFKALLASAEDYISSMNVEGYGDFMEEIGAVNDKYGDNNGVEITFDENKVIVLWVKSYYSLKALFSSTSWCIKDALSTWVSYVGSDDTEVFNKQYAIVNFNLPSSDTKSMIGLTVTNNQGESSGRYRSHDGPVSYAHLKDDRTFVNELDGYMEKWKIPTESIAPMTDEEVSIKKKKINANKAIQKPGITLDEVKQYIDDGANPNIKNGIAIVNAVKAEQEDILDYLFANNGMINIPTEDSKANPKLPIDYSPSVKMTKYLLANGSELTESSITQKIAYDVELIEYAAEKGVDLSIKDSIIMRCAAARGKIEPIKTLIEKDCDISGREYSILKVAVESRHMDLFIFCYDYIKQHREELRKDKNGNPKVELEVVFNDDMTLTEDMCTQYIDAIFYPSMNESDQVYTNKNLSKMDAVTQFISLAAPSDIADQLKAYAEEQWKLRVDSGFATDPDDEIK